MQVLSHSRFKCFARCPWYTQTQPHSSRKSSVGMHTRGGAFEGVYMCEASDMDEKQGLLSREVYEVSATMSASLPSVLSEAVTPHMIALKTNGDGACGSTHFWECLYERRLEHWSFSQSALVKLQRRIWAHPWKSYCNGQVFNGMWNRFVISSGTVSWSHTSKEGKARTVKANCSGNAWFSSTSLS